MAPETEVESTPEERRAMFRVVSGDPSDAEVVALAMVIASASAGPDAPTAEPDRWSAPATSHRRELTPGPGAWKTTYWPR
jgi:hypothetical protein